MSNITGINNFIADGINMGALALRYYQVVKPEKKYNKDSARNIFIRDNNIDFHILRRAVTDIYYDQLGLINVFETKNK